MRDLSTYFIKNVFHRKPAMVCSAYMDTPQGSQEGLTPGEKKAELRRLKKLRVSGSTLVALLRGEHHYVVSQNELPEDAVITRYKQSDAVGAVDLIVWSHSFDSVPEGDQVPAYPDITCTTMNLVKPEDIPEGLAMGVAKPGVHGEPEAPAPETQAEAQAAKDEAPAGQDASA